MVEKIINKFSRHAYLLLFCYIYFTSSKIYVYSDLKRTSCYCCFSSLEKKSGVEQTVTGSVVRWLNENMANVAAIPFVFVLSLKMSIGSPDITSIVQAGRNRI